MEQRGKPLDVMRTLDRPVTDRAGAALGRVTRLMVDPSDGRIDHVMLELAVRPTGTSARIAVPWSQFSLSPDGDALQLDISERVLSAVARRSGKPA